MLEPLKEKDEGIAKLKAQLYESENNCIILSKKLQKKELENKELVKENEKQKARIIKLEDEAGELEEYLDLKRCKSCKHLRPETIMSYVGNENICEECRESGYGK